MGNRLRTAVIVIITVVWAINFIASLAIKSYEPPPEINSIFMGTVGMVLATTPLGSRREGQAQSNEADNRTGDAP